MGHKGNGCRWQKLQQIHALCLLLCHIRHPEDHRNEDGAAANAHTADDACQKPRQQYA